MDKLRLYCVSHKPVTLPPIPGFELLQVGHAPEQFAAHRDNSGDNIAGKNGEYSELTAHYHVWKNLPSDYVGFCHYRRFLFAPGVKPWLETLNPRRYASGYRVREQDLQNYLRDNSAHYLERFRDLFDRADIILPRGNPVPAGGFIKQYIDTHDAAPLFRTLALVAEQDNALGKAMFQYFTNANQGFWNNMFIARWDIFDRYCQFLFPLLERLEREIKLSDSTYQRRAFAFLSERLFNFWVASQGLKAAIVDWCIIDESLRIHEPHHVSRQGG